MWGRFVKNLRHKYFDGKEKLTNNLFAHREESIRANFVNQKGGAGRALDRRPKPGRRADFSCQNQQKKEGLSAAFHLSAQIETTFVQNVCGNRETICHTLHLCTKNGD